MKLSAVTSIRLTPEQVEKVKLLRKRGITTIETFLAGLDMKLKEVEKSIDGNQE